MRDYITAVDIRDAILDVSAEDIAAGNAFIEVQAARHGVRPEQIRPGMMVKRLGACYACYTACLMAEGTDATVNAGGGHESVHVRKLKMYEHELDKLVASMKAADFTGGFGAPETTGGNIQLTRA